MSISFTARVVNLTHSIGCSDRLSEPEYLEHLWDSVMMNCHAREKALHLA